MDKRYVTILRSRRFYIWDKINNTYEPITDELLLYSGTPLVRYLDELNENEAIYYRQVAAYAYDYQLKEDETRSITS